MSKFIDILYDRIKECDAEKTIIVFPSQRALSYFKKKCADEGGTMLLPELMTMEKFAEKVSGIEEEDELFMAAIAFQEFRKRGKADFASFLPIFPKIINDFNDIDMYLKDASLLNNIKEISKLEITDAKSIAQKYFDMMSMMGDIYKLLNEELEKRGRGYRGRIYREASDRAKDYNEFEKIIFAGFNIFTPSEIKMIDALTEAGKAQLLFNIPKILFEKNHESAIHIREYVKRWKEESEMFDCSQNSRIAIYGYSLPTDQPNAIAKEAEDGSCSVVLCDESLMLPAVNCIPERIDKINVTMGYPLSMMPHFFLLRRMMETEDSRRGRDMGKIEVINLIESMRENFLLVKAGEGILKMLYDEKNFLIETDRITEKAEGEERELLELALEWHDSNNELLEPSKILDKIKRFFEIAGMKGEDGNNMGRNGEPIIKSSAATIITEINKLITLIDEGGIEIERKMTKVESVLFALLSGKKIPFSGEPMVDFQVMGMLETRCLQFEKTIIMSVNEGMMPKGKSYNSFIPNDIRREAGLPGYELNDKLFSYYFYSLLLNSKESIITYSHSKSDSTDEKSRFIEQILWEKRRGGIFEGREIELHSPEYNVLSLSSLEKVEKSENVMKLLDEVVLSASSISKFMNCPVDFYFQSLLKIPEMNDEDDLGMDVVGTAVHNALNKFYASKIKEKIRKDEMTINTDTIKQSIKESFSEKGFSNIERGKPYLMSEATARMTERFLECDIKRMDERGSFIVGLEKTLTAGFMFDGRKIMLKGTVDRIENEKESGAVRIMDYKTGSAKEEDVRIIERQELISVEKWLKAENDRWSKIFQLLFYGYLIRHGTDKEGKNVEEAKGKRIKLGIYPLRNPNKELMLCVKPPRKEEEEFFYDEEADKGFSEILNEIIGLIFDKSKAFEKKSSDKLYCKW
ncbi:MAG: PD-(D/E)XK nuclease family protein [bacterium]